MTKVVRHNLEHEENLSAIASSKNLPSSRLGERQTVFQVSNIVTSEGNLGVDEICVSVFVSGRDRQTTSICSDICVTPGQVSARNYGPATSRIWTAFNYVTDSIASRAVVVSIHTKLLGDTHLTMGRSNDDTRVFGATLGASELLSRSIDCSRHTSWAITSYVDNSAIRGENSIDIFSEKIRGGSGPIGWN